MTQSATAFAFSPAKRHPPSRLCRPRRLLIVAVCLSFSLPFAALAQTSAPTSLPPAAQEALDKGIIAAKVPDYPLAIRFFEEARKIAPQASVVFMNLGIAESKMPGRELRAIAWFGAYLAANPDAPNAAAVKEQIAVLDVRNRSNVSRFLKTVQDAAVQLRGYKRTDALANVAGLWAQTGDIAGALTAANLCEGDNDGKGRAYYAVSDALAKVGDIAGAQKTAGMIFQQSRNKRQIMTYIVDAHAAIAKAQVKAGDSAGAQATFDLALRTSELIPALDRGPALDAIAKAQARSGDIAGARKTVGLIVDPTYKSLAQGFVDVEAKFGTPGTRTSVKASDWLTNLDDTSEGSFSFDANDPVPLGHALFRDLAGYLKALPASYKTPAEHMGYKFEKPAEDQRIFDALRETAEKLIYAQNAIGRGLKAQLGK
jgi:tetratricopeptide (TPR) repeat protein